MPGLDIAVSRNGDLVCVRLRGHLDAYTSSRLDTYLRDLRDGGSRNLVLDCERLTYLSSQGVSVLVREMEKLRHDGGDLRLASLTDKVKTIIEHLSLEEYMQVFSDVETAAASYRDG